MALPKQVAQQLKDVEELEAKLNAEPEKTEEPPVEPEADQPEVAETAQATPSQPEPQKTVDSWEQKYRSLQGIFDAEVPALHAKVKELTRELQAATAQINELKAAPKPAPQNAEPLVSDQDVETFGQDLIDLQRRVAREVAAEFRSELAAKDAKIAELEKRIEQASSRVGEVTFEQRLNRMIPDFDQLNSDPKWVDWLDEVDPLTRAPRRLFAQQAYDSGDVEALVHYVNMFRQSIGPAQTQVNQNKAKLERQTAPTRNASSSVSTAQEKVYSTAQVEEMFSKARRLNIQGRFDEANKLEAEITAAYAEGRVRL
jgi:hypothetical protein